MKLPIASSVLGTVRMVASGALEVRLMPKKPRDDFFTYITDGFKGSGLNPVAHADVQAEGNNDMKKAALILGIVSGVSISVGINPSSLTALGIILLVLTAWGRGLVGKETFDGEFWLSFLILLFLPLFVCTLINAIGWPTLIVLILAAAIFICVDLKKRARYTRPNKPTTPNTRGIERTPQYPLHHFNDRERLLDESFEADPEA